jgi:N-acetylmuramoyl-L-alanine amidase
MTRGMILIDNGHGENTPGKRSPDGEFREYLYTREIAQDAHRELVKMGIACELLVRESLDVSLAERVRRVNEYCKEYGAKNVVLLSIHVNAAGDGNRWMNGTGIEVYTSNGKTKSDELAQMFIEAAKNNHKGMKMRTDYSDGDGDKEAQFAVLAKTKCAAILTENGFMDNKEDVKYLLSPEGKRAVVMSHVEAVVKYVNKYMI